MHENSTRAEKKLDLGNGIGIWFVHLDVLREQDLNARVMSDSKFSALVNNIKKDKRLETLPLATWKTNKSGNRELSLISGHHRTRASRAAGVMEIYILVYDEELDPNAIKAKQLAHNAINGTDDPAQLKQIYDSIDDIQRKIESAIHDADINFTVKKIPSEDLTIPMDFEFLSIAFLPNQKKEFEDVVKLLHKNADGDQIILAEFAAFDKFKKAAKKVSKIDNIRNMSAILYRMIKICRAHYDTIEAAQKEKDARENTRVPLDN